MSCKFDYYAIFAEYGAAMNELLLMGDGAPSSVYPNLTAYSANDVDCYKGILIWDAQRYYGSEDMQPVESENSSSCDDVVGFYVVPNFGAVTVVPNVEYRQRITCLFDSNSNPDSDPFGVNISKYIDWFINANYELVSQDPSTPGYFELAEGKRLYILLESISEPIYTKDSIYVRRAVNLMLRYCQCG